MTTASTRSPRPAASPDRSADPDYLSADEVASSLRTSRREAKSLLERHGVAVLAFTERRWIVGAVAFRRLLADLEQQARDRVAQRELKADYLKSAAGRRPRKAVRR
jgi:CBS-domain-containing membrane protein